MIGWIYLSVAVAANIVANVGFKLTMASRPFTIITIAYCLPFWIGLACCAVLFVTYLLALGHLPLSVSYSAVSVLAMAGINIAAVALFGETLSPSKTAGIALAICGIIVLVWSD
jgi:multidrug transporter EmrE-like cation transporter